MYVDVCTVNDNLSKVSLLNTIYHLSAPPGKSINDFINPDTYTLTYCSVDDTFAIVNLLGPGTLLSKIDLKMHFASYQLGKQTGIYLAYFGKEVLYRYMLAIWLALCPLHI